MKNRKTDVFGNIVEKLGKDLEGLQKPKRIRELILMSHIYCEYFIDRVIKKHYNINQENDSFDKQVLDKIGFNRKIGILAHICDFYDVKLDEDRKKILFKNLYELNGNRNSIAHDIDVKSLKFCDHDKQIDEEAVKLVMKCYVPLIVDIHKIETLI